MFHVYICGGVLSVVLGVATALSVDVCILGVLCGFLLYPVHWNSEAFLELLPLWLFFILLIFSCV